jgi:hypothetical protein
MIAWAPAATAARNGTSSHSCSWAAAPDDRQVVVGVDGGVAVAREVLGAGGHAGGLQTADERGAVPRDELGVGAERAHPDDRVVGVGVDVRVRRVVQGDAGVGQVRAEVVGDLLGQRRVVDGAEGQVSGARAAELRLEPGDVPGLLVDRHDDVGTLGAQLCGEGGHLGGRSDVAGEQGDAAEAFAEPAPHPVRGRGADEAGLQHRGGQCSQVAVLIRHGPPYLRWSWVAPPRRRCHAKQPQVPEPVAAASIVTPCRSNSQQTFQ